MNPGAGKLHYSAYKSMAPVDLNMVTLTLVSNTDTK